MEAKEVEQAKEEEEVQEQEQIEVPEQEQIEVPARILDLITSFVDSSTNTDYYFNKPPYIKLLQDGSFWQYTKLECEISPCPCIRLVTWKHDFRICDDIKITVYEKCEKVSEFDHSPKTLLNVVFFSSRRQRKIKLFDVYRKLLFYENLENYYFKQQ